jgi:hypothetical protein
MKQLTMKSRRQFLSSLGVYIALPALESFAAGKGTAEKAKTFVAIGSNLGWYQKGFYPKEVGTGYRMPEVLAPLAKHRNDFTIFSGLDHQAPNGHNHWANFLCGQTVGRYSLDQMIADQIGTNSRFSSVQLVAGGSAAPMSFSKQGTRLPAINRPSVFYQRMFISKADQKHREHILRSGKSAMDYVLEDANRLQKTVSGRDQDALDEYFTSLRSVEKRLETRISRINDPVPTTNYKLPDSDPVAPRQQIECSALMYDLMALAIQNGSSRVLTMQLGGGGPVFELDGKSLGQGYHTLSHHGNNPARIRDLIRIEREHVKRFNGFLNQLKEKKDAQGRPLLDSTLVLLGTGMGDASRHSNRNLPTLVAGGGVKHGRHVAVDPSARAPYLLGDLFISLQQQLGIECERFSNASRNLNSLWGA